MKKSMKKKILWIVLILICAGAVAFGIFWFRSHQKKPAAKKPVKVEKTEKKEPLQEEEIDWTALQGVNPDIYAWINVPGTHVNYPVLQSNENEEEDYYLSHNVDHSEGFPGAVYSQKRNAKDFTDRMTVLYGHNLKDDRMFTTLHSYSKDGFMKDHPYIYIYTPNGSFVYRIFAAYNYDDRLILDYFKDFKDDNTWATYLHSFDELYSGVVDHDVTLDTSCRILTLSTCNSSAPDERFLVQGRLLTEAEAGTISKDDTIKAKNSAAEEAKQMTGGTNQ